MAEHLQLDRKQCEALAQVIVQVAGELHLRLFLRLDQPPAQIVRCFLGEFARGVVERDAAHENRFASGIKLDTATGGYPTHPAVRQHHAIFHLVTAFTTERFRKGFADCFAIFGVQPLENAVHVQPLRLLEAEQFPPLVGRPDFIPQEISTQMPRLAA